MKIAFEEDMSLKPSYKKKKWEDILKAILASEKELDEWLSMAMKGESSLFKSKQDAEFLFKSRYKYYITSLIIGIKQLNGSSILDYLIDTGSTNVETASYEEVNKLIASVLGPRVAAIFEPSNNLRLPPSNISRVAKTSVVPDKECQELLENRFKSELSLCIRPVTNDEDYPVGNICSGDSGGPAVAVIDGRYTQVAVNSGSVSQPPITCKCACR